MIYWMRRDFRANDNWGLLFAQDLAIRLNQPLVVLAQVILPEAGATRRRAAFFEGGLADLADRLNGYSIAFTACTDNSPEPLTQLVAALGAGAVVADQSPLRLSRRLLDSYASTAGVAVYELDAHNIVPVWACSDKAEHAAYTIRPRIQRLLAEFLVEIPALQQHPFPPPALVSAPRLAGIRLDESVGSIHRVPPGETAAQKALVQFFERRLSRYDSERNNPIESTQSGLSAYINAGHLSAQQAAFEAQFQIVPEPEREGFLEQLIVRRELAENFCHHTEAYDSFDQLPSWGRRTLDDHRLDSRPYSYSRETLEQADTHDRLWNAAQEHLVREGTMHGYLRMYWAKKILEWSISPEEAFTTAITLNDRYQLDGCDPNGYAGVAWSIGGLHDRPFAERPGFGKIRYMSYDGCRRKFDVEKYIAAVMPPTLGV